MKAVKINLAGRERYLAFTGEAMFQIQEKFGGTPELLEAMKGNTREAYTATYEAAAILAEQGELARRHMGYEPEPIIDVETLRRTTTPGDIAEIILAIPRVIAIGYGREVGPDDDVVDLGLAELNSQKKTS